MLDILKGKSQLEIKKERVVKLHNLILETSEKMDNLSLALKEAREEQTSNILNSLEMGTPINKKSKNIIRDIQNDIEDQEQLLAGLSQRKKQAIQEFFEVEHADKMLKKSDIKKNVDELERKLSELNKEIKRLEALHLPIYTSLLGFSTEPRTFEKTYYSQDGLTVEDIIKADPFIPFTPNEWAEICKNASNHNVIRIDKTGNVES